MGHWRDTAPEKSGSDHSLVARRDTPRKPRLVLQWTVASVDNRAKSATRVPCCESPRISDKPDPPVGPASRSKILWSKREGDCLLRRSANGNGHRRPCKADWTWVARIPRRLAMVCLTPFPFPVPFPALL